MKLTKPTKNRMFLGLVNDVNEPYWDIFFYARPENGVRKSCYVDTQLFDMPKIVGWCELPEIPDIENMQSINI